MAQHDAHKHLRRTQKDVNATVRKVEGIIDHLPGIAAATGVAAGTAAGAGGGLGAIGGMMAGSAGYAAGTLAKSEYYFLKKLKQR